MKQSRTVLLILTKLAIVSVFAAPAFAATLTDVGTPHPYRGAVSTLGGEGIIDGYNDATLRPEKPVWRDQFEKMVVGAFGRVPTLHEGMSSPFTDLGADDHSDFFPHQYVAAVSREGLMVGKGSGLFAPWDELTTAQLITVMVRALEEIEPGALQTPPAGWKSTLGDFSPSHAANMAKAEYSGLLDGLVGFGPAWDPWQKASRGEAVQILWQVVR